MHVHSNTYMYVHTQTQQHMHVRTVTNANTASHTCTYTHKRKHTCTHIYRTCSTRSHGYYLLPWLNFVRLLFESGIYLLQPHSQATTTTLLRMQSGCKQVPVIEGVEPQLAFESGYHFFQQCWGCGDNSESSD